MPKIIEAVYEDGVFKPLEKVDLKEGEKVRLRVEDIDEILEEFCGLLESKITLEDIKMLREEAKIWRGF